MSVSANYQEDVSTGNGSTVIFSGSWSPIAAAYMRVQLENISTGAITVLAQGAGASQYTLSFTSAGYTVTLGTAPTTSERVRRYRETAQDQSVSYTTSQGFQGSVVENSFDKLTAMIQDLQQEVDEIPSISGTILSGARILLENKILSGVTSAVFSNGFSSAYDLYEFEIFNVSINTSASLNALFSINAGVAFDSGTNYKGRGISAWTEGNVELAIATQRFAYVGVDMADSAAYGRSGKLSVRSPGSVAGLDVNTQWEAAITQTDSGNSIQMSYVQGFYVGAQGSRINAVKFTTNLGAAITGKISLYGIKNS